MKKISLLLLLLVSLFGYGQVLHYHTYSQFELEDKFGEIKETNSGWNKRIILNSNNDTLFQTFGDYRFDGFSSSMSVLSSLRLIRRYYFYQDNRLIKIQDSVSNWVKLSPNSPSPPVDTFSLLSSISFRYNADNISEIKIYKRNGSLYCKYIHQYYTDGTLKKKTKYLSEGETARLERYNDKGDMIELIDFENIITERGGFSNSVKEKNYSFGDSTICFISDFDKHTPILRHTYDYKYDNKDRIVQIIKKSKDYFFTFDKKRTSKYSSFFETNKWPDTSICHHSIDTFIFLYDKAGNKLIFSSDESTVNWISHLNDELPYYSKDTISLGFSIDNYSNHIIKYKKDKFSSIEYYNQDTLVTFFKYDDGKLIESYNCMFENSGWYQYTDSTMFEDSILYTDSIWIASNYNEWVGSFCTYKYDNMDRIIVKDIFEPGNYSSPKLLFREKNEYNIDGLLTKTIIYRGEALIPISGVKITYETSDKDKYWPVNIGQ